MSAKKGRFGRFGGQYAPEVLMPALMELEAAFNRHRKEEIFKEELAAILAEYAGRPTPVTYAENLTRKVGGARIYLKREDLLHGGAHKLNNTLGQALLAKRMGKARLIAETGAGQHGVATAIAAARLGFSCEVYMGAEDIRRQKLNVFRMELLGARVIPVKSGSKTLKDAINEAMRDWLANVESTHYVIGSVVGPHPYPTMVREFQRIIGKETKRQMKKRLGRFPEALVACVGGGSNAMGFFYDFIDEEKVALIGAEAGGKGIRSGRHGATLCEGADGVLHGAYSKLLQDRYGQIAESYSVSAGLDYPGVGPELSHLKESGRLQTVAVSDDDALLAFKILSETEGIMPALESAHAIAAAIKQAKSMKKSQKAIVCLSGRGDKDIHIVAEELGVRL